MHENCGRLAQGHYLKRPLVISGQQFTFYHHINFEDC